MNQKEYINFSLELHLFFDRIMKEHSFFLEVAFAEKDKTLKNVARNFQTTFSHLLSTVLTIANRNIDRNFLASSEMVTEHTLPAEQVTARLSSVPIDTNLTERELNLESGMVQVNGQMIKQIHAINNTALAELQKLIQFKTYILNQVSSCQMYTTNYPLLISHIIKEAQMYFQLLQKVEALEPMSVSALYEQELFWNTIMKEHAEFIRGLLDPTEKELMATANRFAEEYEKLLQNNGVHPLTFTNASLEETLRFRDFKIAGEEGILNCNVKSIIIPLLADHVVREANHFIRLLRSIKSN